MIHHVFANRSNIGDWLSARGIQSLLSGVEVMEHLCDEPFVEETLAQLSQLTADDRIVIGAGGLFMNYFTPFWKPFRRIATRVPFGIWGVGYCDLKEEPSRPPLELIREIIHESSFCFVRDELTRNYLQPHSLPSPVACPSLVAVVQPEEKGFGLLHVDNYTTAGAEIYEAMDRYSKEFSKRTQRPYRQTNNRIRPNDERALQATLRLYTQSDLVVSSALHGCVIALAMSRKVLAVSGDRKIESFMESMGLANWVCDLHEIQKFSELLKALPSQQTPWKQIEQARQAHRLIAEKVQYDFIPAGERKGYSRC